MNCQFISTRATITQILALFLTMITLSQLSKTFLTKYGLFTAVAPTDLTVNAGEIFGIIGASGAGKSTLIRCVNFLEKPTSGQVIIDGIDLGTLSEAKLNASRQKIGMIFQHFNLLHSHTAFDNIALPLKLTNTPKDIINQKVNELLELVGLADKKDHYPANLSGGQKQRVAIARALASNPKILLCDEATSALDPATTNAILDLLKHINRTLGITILLITHEMEVVKRICHKVAIMDKGHIIEQGTVSDLFANPKTPLAKDFIAKTLHLSLPDDYLSKLSPTPAHGLFVVIKFGFSGSSVDLPLFSRASKEFGVEFSILNSQIDYVGGVKFGFTISEVIGEPHCVNKAINYLEAHQVTIERLGYIQL